MNLKKEQRAFMDYIGVSDAKTMDDKLAVAMADSINSAVKRARVYAREDGRKEFRNAWAAELRTTAKQYKNGLTEPAHIRNIARISDTLSRSYGRVLRKKRLRIGISQKALNLYLKHLWCLDQIVEPPHCPLDRIVLVDTAKIMDAKWTCSDCESEYKRWIAQCKKVAHPRSLSVWELASFNNA